MMFLIFIVLGLILGVALGYFGFYLRYEDKKQIDTLIHERKEYKEQLEGLQDEFNSIQEENIILKEYAEKTKIDNEELTKVVAGLSRYSHYIDKGGKLARELVSLLDTLDEEVEEKKERILNHMDSSDDSSNQ